MEDWADSRRKNSYEFYTVDPFTLQETGVAEVDPSASSLTWGYYTDNKVSGGLVMNNSTDRSQLIRVKQLIEMPEQRYYKTLATLFVENSGESSKFKKKDISLSCYSTLWRFTQDMLCYDFFRPVGYNVVQEIRELVEECGGKLNVMPGVDTSRTHTIDIFFEMGTNIGTVLNTIAGWIGCEIHPDESGYITLKPYIAPQDRAVKYTFEAGKNCVYLPGVEMEESSDGVINRVVVWYQVEGTENGNTVVHSDRAVVDLPIGTAFSYEKIGRRATEILEYPYVSFGAEPSNEELVEYGNQYLRNNNGSTTYFDIESVGVPTLTTGDVVRYFNETDFEEPFSALCEITEIDMKLNLGNICRYRLRVI